MADERPVAALTPPGDLQVELRHDGLAVSIGPSLGVPIDVVGGIASGALFVALVVQVPLVGIAVGAVCAFLAFLVVSAARIRWRLDVSSRWIDVERAGLLGRKRWRLPLEEIERCYVGEPREDYSGHFLVLRSRRETLKVAEGRSVEELQWLVDAIGEAVEAHRRREAAEGREWSFQKQAPDALRALVQRD